MIHDIREAFNELLEENEWMDTETRHVAEDKANSMTERIGYPEYITNDTRLQEEYQNVCTANIHYSTMESDLLNSLAWDNFFVFGSLGLYCGIIYPIVPLSHSRGRLLWDNGSMG